MENGPVCRRIAYDYDIKLLAVKFGTMAFQLCADGSHLFRGYTLEAYAQIILIDLQCHYQDQDIESNPRMS